MKTPLSWPIKFIYNVYNAKDRLTILIEPSDENYIQYI